MSFNPVQISTARPVPAFRGQATQDLFEDYLRRLPEDTLARLKEINTMRDREAHIARARELAGVDPVIGLINNLISEHAGKGSELLKDFRIALVRFFQERKKQ